MATAVPIKSLWLDLDEDDPVAARALAERLIRSLEREGVRVRDVTIGKPLVAAIPNTIAAPAPAPRPRVNHVIGGSYHTRPRAR